MERFMKGDVVVLPFPFSDLSAAKKRPALVVATFTGDDMLLGQITSQERFDDYSLGLSNSDFKSGKLPVSSRIRPNRLFTADMAIVNYKIGSLKQNKIKEVEDAIIKIIRQ